MPQTVPQTESILLSYFETGDVPTEDQFAELIRTLFYLQAQTAAAAQAIEDLVNTYALPVAAGRVSYNGVTESVLKQVGCAVTITADRTGPDQSLQLDVVFTEERVDANYIILTEANVSTLRSVSNVATTGFRVTWSGIASAVPTSAHFAVIDEP